MATPNHFLKMVFFVLNKKNESRLFKWETHNNQKCGVHKMATPLGTVRVKLEYKLGKMWSFDWLIDRYFFFFDWLIVSFICLIVVSLVLVG